MSDKALIKSESHLAPWGGRDDVREMAQRLQLTMPGARKLQPAEATALAQIAIAHGLDPFNGEAWFIPGSGVMVGIKGLRKAARRQLKKMHGDDAEFWTQFKRVTNPAEYGAGDTDIVYECFLRDKATSLAWAEVVEKYQSLGIDQAASIEYAGKPPVTIGIGIYRDGEATKMQPNEVARKRAEANAIKQRFDVEFAFEIDAETFDAEYTEWEEPLDPEPRQQAEEIIESLGYEVERPLSPQQVRAAIEKKAGAQHLSKNATEKQRNFLAALLGQCLDNEKNARYLVSEWLTGKPSTKAIPGPMVRAMLDWMNPDSDNNPDPFACQEANAVYREAQKEQGQTEFAA